jgi:predicted AlkP superfamily phosphohydrolase/phosphomutase
VPYLYEKFNKNLDLLVVYVYETDFISHIFWKFMEPDLFQHKIWGLTPKNIEKFGGIIKDMYAMIDKLVKKIIQDVADENTVIIICSDHGFTNHSYRQGGDIVPHILFKNMDKLLSRMGFLQFMNDGESKVSSIIDFTKTFAYHYQLDEASSFPNIFVSLNLKERETAGIIAPGKEYSKLKAELVAALSGLKIVETGEMLFDGVTELSDPQKDIRVAIKSDINLFEQHVKVNGNIYPLSDFYVLLDKSGDHADPGVLIISGKNIKKEKIITGSSILDITPTILYILGLPVAKDMEGNVLTEAFDESFLRMNPIKYIDSYEVAAKPVQKKSSAHLIGEEELEKLRSLGYVH